MRVIAKKKTNKYKLTSWKKKELKYNYKGINKMKNKTEKVRKKKKSNHKFSVSLPHRRGTMVSLETKSFIKFKLFFFFHRQTKKGDKQGNSFVVFGLFLIINILLPIESLRGYVTLPWRWKTPF